MAAIEQSNEDTILRALQNAGVVMYGPTFNVQQYNTLTAEQLRNFALPSFRSHLQSGTSLSQQASPERFSAGGPKTVREDIVARKADILGGQAPLADIQNYESMAFLFGGYNMTIDGQLSEQERSDMDAFLTGLENNVDLSSTYNNNVQVREAAAAEAAAQAAAEAEAAAAQAAITSEVASGLIYSGFLDPADAADTDAVAAAFNNMLAEHRDDPGIDLYGLQTNAFVDPENGNWALSENAAGIFMDLNKNAIAPAEFRSDIESEDPARVTRAQNYLNLQGEELEVNGVVNTATVQAAQALLNKDVAIEGIPHSAINTMAAQGQLLLPSEEEIKDILSDNLDKYDYYQSLFSEADRAPGTFGASREQFIANTLIKEYPAEYEAFLARHNAADAAPLDVTVELATVDTDFLPQTPEAGIVAAAYTEVSLNEESTAVDTNAVINNPFGVEAIDTTIIGGESTLSAALDNDAIAQTPTGEMVFTDQYLVADEIAGAILSSTAVIDGKITMGDALGVYHDIAQTQNDAFLDGASVGGSRPTMQEGDYVAKQLGYDRGHEFDLTDPKEFAAVMTGVLAKANQYDIPGDKHYIDNLLAQQQAQNPTIIALGQDIQMVADARTGVVEALPENTQFATAHGIVDPVVDDVAPETVQVAEPAEPLPQSTIDLQDEEVATFYNKTQEPSAVEKLMDPSQWTPAYGSIIPTPSMFGNPGISSTICLKDQFGACASPITSTPPAGMDIEAPANANMSVANPDILDVGQPRQSQINPNLNLNF